MEPRFYFLYLSHLLYGICVNIFIMNRYISKSYTRSKNTIYRAGAAAVSTIISDSDSDSDIDSDGDSDSENDNDNRDYRKNCGRF